jgi:hypothetical protein
MAKHTSRGCDTGENSGVDTAKSETIPGEGKAEYVTDTISKEGATKSQTVFSGSISGRRLASGQPAMGYPTVVPTLFSSLMGNLEPLSESN